ncbi:hypothetical protein CMO89_01445 [Candidatus Woesearchaeota archaeon]|nr:hypothetical protein [Candidatus Woesearchaeota archaeon]|tara:strand:- start:4586 stop:5809 length:1224 start_codon:yes stop_codon:yes gene_type:complete
MFFYAALTLSTAIGCNIGYEIPEIEIKRNVLFIKGPATYDELGANLDIVDRIDSVSEESGEDIDDIVKIVVEAKLNSLIFDVIRQEYIEGIGNDFSFERDYIEYFFLEDDAGDVSFEGLRRDFDNNTIIDLILNYNGMIDRMMLNAHSTRSGFNNLLSVKDVKSLDETIVESVRAKFSDDFRGIIMGCKSAQDYETLDNTIAESFSWLTGKLFLASSLTIYEMGSLSFEDSIYASYTASGAFHEITPDRMNNIYDVNEAIVGNDSLSAEIYRLCILNGMKRQSSEFDYYTLSIELEIDAYLSGHRLKGIYQISMIAKDFNVSQNPTNLNSLDVKIDNCASKDRYQVHITDSGLDYSLGKAGNLDLFRLSYYDEILTNVLNRAEIIKPEYEEIKFFCDYLFEMIGNEL